MNVRRLAAIDMYGSRGTVRRRRIIQAEFTAALAATVALGIWLAIEASGLGTRILGIWLMGAGVNYAPLAVYAILLSRPGALEAELADVDTGQELRRYSVLQLWILVPLSLIAMTAQGRKPAPDQLLRTDPATADTSRSAADEVENLLRSAGFTHLSTETSPQQSLPEHCSTLTGTGRWRGEKKA